MMPILRVVYMFSMNCMRCLGCKRGQAGQWARLGRRRCSASNN
jgi:hypothetical protein